MDVAHHTFQNDGLTLHYAEAGPPDRPAILFLHGFPEHWRAWRPVMARLAPTHRVVAMDTRGIARSDAPADVEGYRTKHLVADTVALIDRLRAESGDVTLVGHDWGGFIAWATAIRHPERVARLAILNAGHPGIFGELLATDDGQREASRYMLAFRSERGEELLSRNDFAGFRQQILDPPGNNFDEAERERYLAVWRDGKSLTAGLNYYRANESGPPPEGTTARPATDLTVRVPTLVIWGNRDPYFVPANVERLPEVVPDLRTERYADNDHWIAHQRPDDVARRLAAFVADRR